MNEKKHDARYVRINGNYYAQKKIDFYEAHPLTDEQLELLKPEEVNMQRALRSHNCSRPSLAALKLMGAIFGVRPNPGCQYCIVGLVTDMAQMYYYFKDKAIEEENAKAFVQVTLEQEAKPQAEAPKPAPKKAPAKKKAAPKKKTSK